MISPPPPPSSPEPAASAAASASGPASASGRGARRALGVALTAGALGAAAVLVAAGQVWSEGTAVLAQGEVPVRAEGSEVTGLPSALALVGLAALVAVFAVRRAGRTLVAALLALCGAGTAVAALLGAGDRSALEAEAARASGLTRGTVEAVSFGVWPYVAALGGVLLLAAGLLALRHGRRWPAMSGRHERAGGARAGAARRTAPDPDRPEELWRALDRGEDPTTGSGGNRP
ncbi:TIGR02234 family membrane protein [Streptomyces sp. DH37]|uniref:TIGR02234 family membrane protein n=1 Tax=Streptomyces sp. DH37 TaxID=3040122 RepID=UPI0024422803|nr:TIGR02234 family membrane protein [Streptomyces sp. DH37]MDG9703977.1 TIGR02234 family membrane protein [Streptomyces sp. DH37]